MAKYCVNPRLLQAHPILARLLGLKQALASMEKLDFAPGSEQDDDMDLNEYDLEEDMESLAAQYNSPWAMDEPNLDDPQYTTKETGVTKARLNGTASEVAEKPQLNGSGPVKPKKKKKEKGDKTNKPKPDFVFDLEEPEFVASNQKKSRAAESTRELPSFGEHSSLNAVDSADKAARKKSLRFHTSRIESTAAKRAKAVVGGDDDIPYRERQKEKQLRLERDSAKRAGTLGQGGDDLEPVEPAKIGTKRSREENDDLGADGYYELVKRQKQENSSNKKAEYAAERALEKQVHAPKYTLQ
jgi:U3 small nucleolar RNA-associated protein 3